MKSPVFNFLFVAMIGFVLAGCAPTMSIKTEGSSGASLDKGALHYIIPPRASDPAEMKNLYPLVVEAFKQNQIALTSSRKAAVYTVTWGSEEKSTQVKSLQGTPYSSGWGSLNANAADAWGNSIYGQSATGPEYNSVMRSVKMQSFMITVWKKEGAENAQPVQVWTGNAEIDYHDAKHAAVIIDQIVARYGTNFEGQAQIK
jgi:hypothetical protein